jgi:CheY-like chemotaxis protein
MDETRFDTDLQESKEKMRFLDNMSHDIRTPLNAILGYARLAQQQIDNPDRVQDYLKKISVSGEQLLSLLGDCLEMSRMEQPDFALEKRACNLHKVLENLHTVMIGQMQEKQLHFQMDTDIRNADILCDELRLNQVLLHILENAVKYTPADGKITVRVAQPDKCAKTGHAAYRFLIEDNGIGMSEEFQTHLFESFSREKNSTASGVPGSGLGLAISKRLVDLMGGTISVQSRLGEGTKVVIELEFPLQEAGVAKKEPGRQKGARKLLLVEDNPLNQEIAAEILMDNGFEIEVANDGSEAVEMVSKALPGYYNAVLMDLQMPIMNGYEAARRIRMLNNQLLSNIPIIALTANAFEEDRKKALEAGMNDFVAKPIDVKKLLDALEDSCA